MIDVPKLEEMTKAFLLSQPDNQPGPFELRISAAGDCPRLLDYRMQFGRPAPDAAQAMRMLMGNWMHSMWQWIMNGAFGSDFMNAEQETHVQVDDLQVPGHPDGEINSFDCVWEFKSVSMNTFSMVVEQDHPIPSHYVQGNMYAHARKRKWILFHYFCRDNGESFFIVVPYSESVANSTIETMRVRRANRAKGALADRPYHDPNESPCWFCERKTDCYKDFTKEFESYQRHELKSEEYPAVLASANAAASARDTRLKAEKDEDLAKKQITTFMHEKKLKSFKLDSLFAVDAKIGKNLNTIVNIKSLTKKGDANE